MYGGLDKAPKSPEKVLAIPSLKYPGHPEACMTYELEPELLEGELDRGVLQGVLRGILAHLIPVTTPNELTQPG